MKRIALSLALFCASVTLAQASNANGQHLAGTWSVAVTFTEGAPPGVTAFLGLRTFLDGGGLIETIAFPQTLAGPNGPTLVTGPGTHGEWMRTGDRQFATTFLFYQTDPKGSLLTIVKIRETLKLSDSLDTYESTWRGEAVTPDGTRIAAFAGKAQGKRIDIEAMESAQ